MDTEHYGIGRRAMSRSEIEQRLDDLQQNNPEVEEIVLLVGGLFVIQEIEAAYRESAGSDDEADEQIASIRVGPVVRFDAQDGSPLL